MPANPTEVPEATHRELFVSNSTRRRMARAQQVVAEGEGGALVVAPSRGAADDLVRGAVSRGAGLFGVHRTTSFRLATELAVPVLAATGVVPLTQLGTEALAARVIAEADDAGELEYFDAVAAFPGFAKALTRTLSELRMADLRPAALAADSGPGRDLARLLRRYEAVLAAEALADDAEVWRVAVARLADPDAVSFATLVLLDCPPRSVLDARLFAGLVASAQRVVATAIAGDTEGIERLRACLDCAVTRERPGSGERAAARLARLRRWVFVDTDEEAPEEPAPPVAAEPASSGSAAASAADAAGPPSGDAAADSTDDSVQFVAAPGEGRECVEIARRIQQLAADGVAFDRVAVLLRNPESYLGLLEEALGRADVPAYFTRGSQRPHPSGRAFLALLACRAEQLSASRFAEYLSLGEAPAPDASGAPVRVEMPWVQPDGQQLVFKTEVDLAPPPGETARPRPLATPRNWERLLVDAAVVGGGPERWQRRLAGLQHELRLRLQRLDDDDPGRAAHLHRQIAGLEALERFSLPLLDVLDGLPPQASWGGWLEALASLARRALRRPDQVLAVLAELEPMAEIGPVDLGEVRRVLEERLTLLRTEPSRHRYGRVYVGSLDECGGRSFHTVFLPGLAEGIFPRKTFEDPLLLDAARRRVAPGVLLDRDARVARERLLLRVAAAAAEQAIVVSYPTVDSAQGRARVPSFYALDVMRAAEGALPSLEALKRQAAAGSFARLGWPAPEDEKLAIDITEYDVAYLEPFLRNADSVQPGRARFLLGENASLERSLRTRWSRWSRKFHGADGIVDPNEATRAVLARHSLKARSYSPTALQTYAVCPYRFLLYAVHRLRPREEPVALEQLDPLTRGSLFHDVQYRLYRRLRDDGVLPITLANRDDVKRVADQELATVAAEYEEKLAPAILRVWQDEIQGLGTDLRGWIHAVAENDRDWVPTYFEFSFGLGAEPGRDPLSHRDEAVVLDGYRLRGSIDLVEKREKDGHWRVTDHKTGRSPRERLLVINRGEVLQPLLYSLAAEHHLDGEVEAGRLFFCTRRGEYETRTVDLNTDSRAKAREVLSRIDKEIVGGFLPAAPRAKACQYCDYKTVCGPYEETRIRRKRDRGRLASLEQIRGIS